ncbi:hypothetical protein, partial [uncultured Treponema sp.]|uniref:hypothetical protein n=1 Tax=uncultured Treponema sp. TaxID=162155 RepID=UPI00259584CE
MFCNKKKAKKINCCINVSIIIIVIFRAAKLYLKLKDTLFMQHEIRYNINMKNSGFNGIILDIDGT